MDVLVVDDDSLILEQIERFLSRHDYAVVTATSGTVALERLRSQSFDVVFTDLKMPQIDGLQLLAHVRQTHPETFVIMLTGFGTVESAVEAMKLGAYDYLPKPFKAKDLVEKLEHIHQEKMIRTNMENVRLIEQFEGIDYFEFLSTANLDAPMLLVTRDDPIAVIARYHLEGAEGVWMTEEVGEGVRISPRRLVDLKGVIQSFTTRHERGIILLQGLEQLIAIHQWTNVKKFIYVLYEQLVGPKHRIILTTDPTGLESGVLQDIGSLVTQDFFKTFGDSLTNKARVDIVHFLQQKGPQPFGAIKDALGVINSSALAFHLKKLAKDDVIASTREEGYHLTARGVRFSELMQGIQEMGLTDVSSNFLLLVDRPGPRELPAPQSDGRVPSASQ